MDQENNNKTKRYKPFHQKKPDEVRSEEVFEDIAIEIDVEEAIEIEENKVAEALNFQGLDPKAQNVKEETMNNTPPKDFVASSAESVVDVEVEAIDLEGMFWEDGSSGGDSVPQAVKDEDKMTDIEVEIEPVSDHNTEQEQKDVEELDVVDIPVESVEPLSDQESEPEDISESRDLTKLDSNQKRQEGNADAQGALKTYGSDIYQSENGAHDSIRKEGRMGDRMISMGLIDGDQLNVALQEKKTSQKMLGEILVELGFITEQNLMSYIAEQAGFDLFDPATSIVDGDALALLEKPVALKQKVLPVSIDGNDVYVAMIDPYDVVAMDTLRAHLPKGVRVRPMMAAAQTMTEAIDAAYGYASSINAILKELEEEEELEDVATLNEGEAFSHPVVRLVNALVFDAVKIGASDLHFEPEESFIRLRYRVDGVLYTAQTLHKQHWNSISQRIKILCEMNIADKINAQDGRFGINVGGREVDFRVSSLPTVHGENIVLRVLDKSSSIMEMTDLGFSEHNLDLIKQSQLKPEGIIIVTGPTGSGKTTSLYSMINEINTVDVNIQTLEDPVEYSLPMIRQTAVREGILDFADGIKALLRQDPDIIFIGEVRDKTTAEMALKAAMTGHQVYTTLHTNDSFGAIPRLLDLGLKPGMISGAIVSVFAQRLTRRLCGSCKESYTPDAQECEILGVDPSNPPEVFRAHQGGCGTCGGQGYKGRTAVVEILKFDEDMDEILAKGADKVDLKNEAVKKGFKSMRDDGILKVLDGVTDLAALSKVVDITR